MQRFASTRPGAWTFSKVLRHLDDAVGRLSRGRTSAPEVLAGLPVLDVATTGRKSGLRRTTHLIAVPSTTPSPCSAPTSGSPSTPAWVLNLEADPHASVTYQHRTVEAVARPATEAEHARVLAGSAQVYGGYLKYQQRITGRRLRIFLLHPAESSPAD